MTRFPGERRLPQIDPTSGQPIPHNPAGFDLWVKREWGNDTGDVRAAAQRTANEMNTLGPCCDRARWRAVAGNLFAAAAVLALLGLFALAFAGGWS